MLEMCSAQPFVLPQLACPQPVLLILCFSPFSQSAPCLGVWTWLRLPLFSVPVGGVWSLRTTDPRSDLSTDTGYERVDRSEGGWPRGSRGPLYTLTLYRLIQILIMAVDGCGLVCKYIIILFDCIFAVLGAAMLCLGLWLRFSDSTRAIFQIEDFNSTTFVISVIVLIVLGTLMLIVVSFGDYGACSEKTGSLKVFSCLVAILAGAEIIIGVLAYTNSKAVGDWMANFYVDLYTVYVATADPGIALTLTFLQKMLYCCGLSGIPLVDLAKKTCPAPKGFWDGLKMPACPSTITTVFDGRAPLVLGSFLGTGALLITAWWCSIILLKHLKRSHRAVETYYSHIY
uniref:Tetraspanin n=1 Tax=Knipowitschia caucasica TaxID=637954 RepID=A0AAV2KFR5_KNICA